MTYFGDDSRRPACEAFWVDKDGIPHWDGEDVKYLTQYKLRVAGL